MESQGTNPAKTVHVASGLYAAGGAFLAAGVVTGALGAHAMERVLDEDGVGAFITASHYLLFMGAALLGALSTGREAGLRWVVWGTVLFSGSIFGLLIGKVVGFPIPILGPVTPVGGGS